LLITSSFNVPICDAASSTHIYNAVGVEAPFGAPASQLRRAGNGMSPSDIRSTGRWRPVARQRMTRRRSACWWKTPSRANKSAPRRQSAH